MQSRKDCGFHVSYLPLNAEKCQSTPPPLFQAAVPVRVMRPYLPVPSIFYTAMLKEKEEKGNEVTTPSPCFLTSRRQEWVCFLVGASTTQLLKGMTVQSRRAAPGLHPACPSPQHPDPE